MYTLLDISYPLMKVLLLLVLSIYFTLLIIHVNRAIFNKHILKGLSHLPLIKLFINEDFDSGWDTY